MFDGTPVKKEDLPDIKGFMEELQDGETAREFLMHMVGLGYIITDLEGVDLRQLPDGEATKLATVQFQIFYLEEYPHYGEEPQ